jgi:ferritin-like metal-binding protein YciE
MPKSVNCRKVQGIEEGVEKSPSRTDGQIERLSQVCNILGAGPKGKSWDEGVHWRKAHRC